MKYIMMNNNIMRVILDLLQLCLILPFRGRSEGPPVSTMTLTLSWSMGLKAKIPEILDNVSLFFLVGGLLSSTSNLTSNFRKPTIMGQRSK